MSFAAREIGSVTGSSGSKNSTFTVVVDQGTNVYGPGVAYDSWFWGWCPNTAAKGLVYPDSPFGSCSTASPGLGTLAVVGVYSVGYNVTNYANIYYVLIAGKITSGLTSLKVAGTTVGSGPTSYTYDSTNNCTQVVFLPGSVTTTLFGTTVGANITVQIA